MKSYTIRRKTARAAHRAPLERHIDYHGFWSAELGIELRKITGDGWCSGGLNPLREDHQPGSFRVNTIHGGYCDFADGEGGSAADFLMRRYGFTFAEAMTFLVDGFAQ